MKAAITPLRAAHEMTLQEIEEERAAADVTAGDEQLRRELAAQEGAAAPVMMELPRPL